MKKTPILIALAAMLGLALASTIPALAQEQEEPSQPADACSYHDARDRPHDEMESWMGSGAHDEWMQSTEHSRMHETMEGPHGMMNGNGMMNDPGSRRDGGGMMGYSG